MTMENVNLSSMAMMMMKIMVTMMSMMTMMKKSPVQCDLSGQLKAIFCPSWVIMEAYVNWDVISCCWLILLIVELS